MKKILLLLLIILLVSCNRITEGHIINKVYIPAHKEQYSTTILVGKVPIIQWHIRYVPDKWYITFEGCNKYGTLKERCILVSLDTYNTHNIGEYITLVEDNNNER